MRRRTAILLACLAAWLGLLGWYVSGVIADRRFRGELLRAEREIAEGRLAEARRRLSTLAAQWPGRGNVEFHLAACEILDGRVDAALAAWGRVPDSAPQAASAALFRGRVAADNGRLGLAETCLERAERAGGAIADEARKQLGRVYWLEGRRDDYERVLRRVAERESDPSLSLQRIWNTQNLAFPTDETRAEVEKALRASPDDDRGWLAAADLATRLARFDEAAGWLARCEQARPDDPSVWRARLEWAQAADRPDDARRAARHLAVSAIPRARVARLLAWLAARRGDREGERKALEESSALEPRDTASLERLADLATQAGDTRRAVDLRRRKATLDAAVARYQGRTTQPDMASHAEELARDAETMGRRFDALLWWELAARRDPGLRAEADAARPRLAEPAEPDRPAATTLADLLPAPEPARDQPAVAADVVVPRFEDDTAARGLTFTFDNGLSDARQLPETMSGGVGLLDFDGDGWLDIYAVQGGRFPPVAAGSGFGDRLFRNVSGRFEDVTKASGLSSLPGGYGHGVAVGDYDNDGRPDLFVTRWRSYALYHNLGGGRFEDATAAAGLAGDRDWPTSAAWADLDGDGDLDLYVCHYVAWDADHPVVCGGPTAKGPTYCDPRTFPSMPDHLFRNDGGRFVDVTAEAGIVDREGRGLGVVADDLDGDGRVDLFVANDTTANFSFHNQGGWKFRDDAIEAGLATSAVGGYMAGMGVARGDLDGDGRVDLAVTNFFGEATTLYHNLGGGLFADRTVASGLGGATRFVLGFGLAAADVNNDGRLDLVQANGHVNDIRPSAPFEMSAQLLLGAGAGRFVDASDRSGPVWKTLRLGRGLAVGDLDNDGRIDALIVSQNAPLALLRNGAPGDGHFLTLALEGTRSNRDAVGTRVEVTAGGTTRVATRFGGGSYLSAGDPRLHFGLGASARVDRVEILWPSGRRDRYEGLAADVGYRLREGDPSPRPLQGFAAGAR